MEPKEPWEKRWALGHTDWDIGAAHPLCDEALDLAIKEGGLASGGHFLVPGCGRGHEVGYLSKRGFRADGIDFVPQAIREAQSLYGKFDGVRFSVEDVFQGNGDRDYDGIIDRAMLCAIQPEARTSYIEAMGKRLRSGGLFIGLLFADLDSGLNQGPPYKLDEREVSDLFLDQFDLVAWESHPNHATPSVVLKTWLCIWRKKS